MTTEQQIARLIVTKLSLDDDFEQGIITYEKYNSLCNKIDSLINSLNN